MREAWGKFEELGRTVGSEQWAITMRLLAAKDFDGFDALAAKYRTKKAQFLSGMWRIFALYEDIADPSVDTPGGWEKH